MVAIVPGITDKGAVARHHGQHAYARQVRALRSAAAALGLGVLGTAAAVATSVGIVRRAAQGHLYPLEQVPSAPVALVLGAQVYPNGMPSRFLRARLDLALVLLEQGTVDRLLLSGDARAPEYDEPAAMRDHLRSAGVPDDRLMLDPYGLDTYDSCVRAREVYGIDRVVIVTQAYHLPRAVGTARLLGLDAAGVGDRTVRTHEDGSGLNEPWVRGWVRDQIACAKTIWDVGSRRRPVGLR
jgi:vancomycin permeability regulator SanA